MILSLEQVTEILAKVGISSSLEEEILTAAESLITPLAKNKDDEEILTASEFLITPPTTNKESTFKESYTFDEERSCKKEVEEDNKELQHDMRSENYA